jgi:hypothetical protein
MSVDVGRRVFVGSVVTGLPLLVGAQLAWAQRSGGTARVQDPVVSQLLADMKQAVRGLSKAPSGEHTRRLASSLRLLSAWGASNQFDAKVKDTLRGVVAREGREALLRRTADPAAFKAEAGELGFDRTSAVPLPPVASVDYATRERIVNDLLANGVTARWTRLAEALEVSATAMDRQASTRSRGITLVAQVDPGCAMIQEQLNYLSVQMAFWCAPWFWWVPEPCALATSAYLGVWAAEWWRGC